MALAGDHIIVKLDDSDGTPQQFASGDIISIDLPQTVEQYDVTGFGDVTTDVISGLMSMPVTIRGYVTLTGTTGTHTVLRNVYQQGKQVTLEVQIGNNATPTTGDPKLSGEYYVESYVQVIETGKAITFTARLIPAGATAPAWTTL